jgi:hypothetical protein
METDKMEKGNIANCSVLYLEKYNFENWFNNSIEFLKLLKLEPTHIGVQNTGKSSKITKYQTGYKKLLLSEFKDITSIGLYVCEEGEQSPGFNWIANLNIYYNRFIGFICFWGVDETLISLDKLTFDVLNSYNNFETLIYGYSYEYLHNKYPYFYALGMSSQKDSAEEKETLSKWINSMKEIKSGRIREVYKINIFKELTLSIKSKLGLSLKEYILRSNTTLKAIKSGIYVYEPSKESIANIKSEFGKELILT